MNKQKKISYVQDVAGEIVSEIIDFIIDDKIPDHWDKAELRRYISDKFQALEQPKIMHGERLSSYAWYCTERGL